MFLQESVEVFLGLYRPWCHNPVATLALCLLTQNYNHACDLIKSLYPFKIHVMLRLKKKKEK